MMAFSEQRRWIISVFDRRSIMNRLYWNNQQVGYLCFIPFVWEQRGVIAAVADQSAIISHLLHLAEPLGDGHEGMWARFGSQGSNALNWHSRYSGTLYSGTWLYHLSVEISQKMQIYFHVFLASALQLSQSCVDFPCHLVLVAHLSVCLSGTVAGLTVTPAGATGCKSDSLSLHLSVFSAKNTTWFTSKVDHSSTV